MQEVRTCDFCDGDATGVYEVVPANTGAASDARRMLLCDGCQGTLASVVDPLLDALDDNGDVSTDTASDSTTDGANAARSAAGSDTVEQDADPGGGEDPATAVNAGDDSRGSEAGGRPLSERGPPRGYRKVLRFLENRELPIDRDDAEELVEDAYGMSSDEVAAAIDHAVKHDRLRDVNGELRR